MAPTLADQYFIMLINYQASKHPNAFIPSFSEKFLSDVIEAGHAKENIFRTFKNFTFDMIHNERPDSRVPMRRIDGEQTDVRATHKPIFEH
jgi:hypothetical protein